MACAYIHIRLPFSFDLLSFLFISIYIFLGNAPVMTISYCPSSWDLLLTSLAMVAMSIVEAFLNGIGIADINCNFTYSCFHWKSDEYMPCVNFILG